MVTAHNVNPPKKCGTCKITKSAHLLTVDFKHLLCTTTQSMMSQLSQIQSLIAQTHLLCSLNSSQIQSTLSSSSFLHLLRNVENIYRKVEDKLATSCVASPLNSISCSSKYKLNSPNRHHVVVHNLLQSSKKLN